MQNPPPGQQSYGTPSGAPPSQPAGKSSIGLDPNVAAAISYIWIVGLIFFFMEKESRFIRFHAMQSVLLGISSSIVIVALVIVNIIFAIIAGVISQAVGSGAGSLFGLLVWLISLVLWLIPLLLLAGLIVAAVKAYQGNLFKLPIIGNMAEKIAGK